MRGRISEQLWRKHPHFDAVLRQMLGERSLPAVGEWDAPITAESQVAKTRTQKEISRQLRHGLRIGIETHNRTEPFGSQNIDYWMLQSKKSARHPTIFDSRNDT